MNHNDTSTGGLSGWGPWTAVPGKYRKHGLPIILVGIAFDPETRSIAAYKTAAIHPHPADW